MKKYFQSLKGKVFAMLSAAVIPIVIAFIFINIYTMHLVQQEIFEKNHDLLEFQMQQLDYELNSIAEYLKHLDYDDKYTGSFASVSDTKEAKKQQYYASNYYFTSIRTSIDMYDYVEGMAIIAPANDARIYVFSEDRSDSYGTRTLMMDYLRENLDRLKNTKNYWQSCEVGGQYYLIYVFGWSDVYFCAWTGTDNLLKNADNWKITGSSALFIADNDGQQMSVANEVGAGEVDLGIHSDKYYFSGPNNRYLMTGVGSANGDFRLFSAVDRTKLLRPYCLLQVGLVCAILLFAGMIPVVLRALGVNIFRPMNRMLGAIDHIERGELEYQIEEKKDNREFRHLISAFNQMVRQIKDLKIHAYEEELARQQIMMEYMQVQIEPHFYLNALNIINTMAQVGDTELIGQLTSNLSEYLRYIAKTKTNAVTIGEEMSHIENYIRIMQIRFGETFDYSEDMDETVIRVAIPPLLIQTIIENSMKYAFDVYGNTKIHVYIRRETGTLPVSGEGGAGMSDSGGGGVGGDACPAAAGVAITVTDNGRGYPEEYIRRFNGADSWEGEQIGLWNAKMRLYYMYGQDASLTVDNLPEGGACTQIRIPLKGSDRPAGGAALDADIRNEGKTSNESIDCG